MTTERRGVSLIETLVACSIFAVLTTAIVMILAQSRQAEQKLDTHSDSTQMGLVVVEKIKQEMRLSRVMGTDGSRLDYWILRRSNGTLQLTAAGLPDYEPGAPDPPAVAQLFCSQGALFRQFQGIRQKLAAMGREGAIGFVHNPAQHTLKLHITVGEDAHDKVKSNKIQLHYTVYLNNQ
jgi:prepilin-type N-terminal cleavage/methylation domain-containing protein